MKIKKLGALLVSAALCAGEGRTRLRHQRNELLSAAIGIVGVVIVHQRQVALRGQGTGLLIGHGDYVFFIGGRSQDGLFYFLHRLTTISKSRSCHASAQCH